MTEMRSSFERVLLMKARVAESLSFDAIQWRHAYLTVTTHVAPFFHRIRYLQAVSIANPKQIPTARPIL